jgi:ferritin-like metal-binding protein YciE
MAITDARALFVHELEDMVSAEHLIVKMLPELAKEAHDPEAKTAFEEHETETKQQIKRLQEAFKLLGETPEESTCYATEGLKQEHAALHGEDPTPEVLAIGGLLGAAKTEAYEIAGYAALVQMAKDLGEPNVAALLKETLDEEQAMAKRVTALAKGAGKEAKTATAA